MIRNYKAFGLALMAMLALGAFVAQGATASPLTVEGVVAPNPFFATGDQDGGTHTFTSSAGNVTCAQASFSTSKAVEAGGAVRELTVTPSYPTEKTGGGNNCVAFGFANAHVKTNECTYTFTTPTSLGGGQVTWSGSTQIHLVCPTGKVIEITPTSFGVSVCTETIEPQTPTSGHVVGKNIAGSSPMEVTLEITLTGIHYIGHGAPCDPEPGGVKTTTQSNGTLTGNSRIKCYSNAAHTAQVGCTFS